MFKTQDIARAAALHSFFHAHPKLKIEEPQTAAGKDKPYLHDAVYDFNDDILTVATGTFVAIVKDMLV